MEAEGTTCTDRRQGICRWFVFSPVLLGGLVLLGCATQSATHVQQPFEAVKHRAIRIEPCADRTGFMGERDLAGEATRVLTKKIQATQLFEITPDAHLVLTCDIERFAEGSALKRWVMPGWGSTLVSVAVMVWEKPGDNILSTFRSQSSVKEGGLYTVGADQYILSVAFNDIVDQLRSWATKGKHQEGSREAE